MRMRGMCLTLVLVAKRKPELQLGETISWCVSGSLGFTRLVLHFHMVYLARQKAFLSLCRSFFSAQLASLAPRVGMFAATVDSSPSRAEPAMNNWRHLAAERKELRFDKPKENPLTERVRRGKQEAEGEREEGRR